MQIPTYVLFHSIDSKKFEAWLEEVCKALPPKSCLVMDNASYHSKLVSAYIFATNQNVLFGKFKRMKTINILYAIYLLNPHFLSVRHAVALAANLRLR